MSHTLRITAMARAAALSVALLVPAASGAFAQQSTLDQIYQPGVNDAFGAQTQQQVLRAAGGAPMAAPLTVEQRRKLDKEFMASPSPLACWWMRASLSPKMRFAI